MASLGDADAIKKGDLPDLDPPRGYDEDATFTGVSGGAKVIASGSILPLEKERCVISIPMGPKSPPLSLEIIFLKDAENTAQRFGIQAIEGNPQTLRLVLCNADSPLGGGPPAPLTLWKSEKSEVVAILRIYTVLDGVPLIHFTFYLRPT